MTDTIYRPGQQSTTVEISRFFMTEQQNLLIPLIYNSRNFKVLHDNACNAVVIISTTVEISRFFMTNQSKNHIRHLQQ